MDILPENKDNNSENSSINTEQSDSRNELLEHTTSPVKAALISLITIFLLYQIGGGLLTFLIFGLDFAHADINALRLLTAGGQILLILSPALIFSYLVYNGKVTKVIRFNKLDLREAGMFLLGMIPLIIMLQNFLYIQNYLIQKLADSSSFVMYVKKMFDQVDKLLNESYGDLMKANNFLEVILIVFVTSFIPAICEEVFFRGFVQKSFEQKLKPLIAIFLTALFFGIYHFNPYGLIALVTLGVYFGYAVYQTNSIFVSMILHFFNNFLAVVLVLIYGNEELLNSNVTDEKGIMMQIFSFILLFVFFVFYIILVNRYFNKKKTVRLI
jgi:membrane protease YdiL (CAAX protease family)